MQKNDNILEYLERDKNLPAIYLSHSKTEYDLFTLKTKWVWPFKITKIPVNLRMMTPDNTIGIIMGKDSAADMGLEIHSGIIHELTPFGFAFQELHINVHKIGILPRRIKAGSSIAQIIIIPYVQCNLVESYNTRR